MFICCIISLMNMKCVIDFFLRPNQKDSYYMFLYCCIIFHSKIFINPVVFDRFRCNGRAIFSNVSLSLLSTSLFHYVGRVVDSQCKTDYFEVILRKNKLNMVIISMISVKKTRNIDISIFVKLKSFIDS